MNNTSSLTLVADLELEEAILSQVLFLSSAAKMGQISEDDKACLHTSIELINSAGFSYSVNKDIFDYISHSIGTSKKYPDPWEVSRYLQGLPKNKANQNTLAKYIQDLLLRVESSVFSLRSVPLPELASRFTHLANQRKLKQKLQSEIKTEHDIEELKTLIDEISNPLSTKEKISEGVLKYQSAKDPVDRVLAKRELRMQGLVPQEVSEITDGFVPFRDAPKIVSALDFMMEEFQEASWIYPGLIKAGVCNLITGIGGSGKTIFAIDAMMSYLDNASFIGEVPSILARNSQNRGLIINADQPFSDLQGILKSNPRAWKLAKQGKFDILRTNWCLADILHLEFCLKDGIYNFVVVDSYKAIHSHIVDWDENKSEASRGLRELQRLCDLYGATMLVIHHAGNTSEKGRHKSRGHSSIPDTASSVINITASHVDDKNGDPNVRFLEISKSRNSERQLLTIKFNPLNYSYELLPDTKGQERKRVGALADTMIREFTLAFPNRLSTDALLKKMAGSPNKEVLLSKVLQKLEQRGLITKQVDEINPEIFMYSLSKASTERKEQPKEESKPGLRLVHSRPDLRPTDVIDSMDDFIDF